MSSRKYEFTGDTVKHIGGCTLHRIKALVDIEKAGVKAGQLGGWIESEKNLSHKGSCWVADSAMVYGDATVCSDAVVKNCAEVYGDVVIRGGSIVADCAEVYVDAEIFGSVVVSGPCDLRENDAEFNMCENTKADTTSAFAPEEEVNVNVALPCSCFYTFIDELRRQSNMLFGKICTIESLEGKRRAARYAESMSQLADKLSNEKL